MSTGQTRVKTRPGALELESSIEAPCTVEEAWAVITDYDRLGSYMPNLESREVGRTARGTLVRQTGTSSLSPLVRFQFVLELVRENPSVLSFRQAAGNLRRYEGYWSVVPAGRGVRISYRARVVHGFPLSGRILESLVRTDVEKIMPAIVAEVSRRAALSLDSRATQRAYSRRAS